MDSSSSLDLYEFAPIDSNEALDKSGGEKHIDYNSPPRGLEQTVDTPLDQAAFRKDPIKSNDPREYLYSPVTDTGAASPPLWEQSSLFEVNTNNTVIGNTDSFSSKSYEEKKYKEEYQITQPDYEKVAKSIALIVASFTLGHILRGLNMKWVETAQNSLKHKLVLILITVYMSVSYSNSTDANYVYSPFKIFKISLLIVIYYILLSGLNHKFFTIIVLLFFGIVVYKDYIKFEQFQSLQEGSDPSVQSNKWYDIEMLEFLKILGILIILGFWWNFDHNRNMIGSKKFDSFKFIFKTGQHQTN